MKVPTHAGGVVVRTDGTAARYLLVSARLTPNEWVLPKGHIEPSEKPEDTAVREVLEEAGVVAVPATRLDTIEFSNWRGPVRAQFFLMRYAGEGEASERRRLAWMPVDEAVAALGFEDMRRLVRATHELVTAEMGS